MNVGSEWGDVGAGGGGVECWGSAGRRGMRGAGAGMLGAAGGMLGLRD